MTRTEETTVSRAPVGTIVEVKGGQVLLKREGWSDYHPTDAGTELYDGDLLNPTRGTIVHILCADRKTIVLVPAGVISSAMTHCPAQSISFSRRKSNIIGIRAEINTLIPYIISPRRTSLLNDKPKLCWNAVFGATRYTVRVRGPKRVIWETQVSGNEVVYTGEPPLEPGVEYLLIVETDNGASSKDEPVPGALKFKLLNETDAQLVRADLEQLTKHELADEAQALSQAYLYLRYELRAEAIETLEAIASKGSQIAGVYRTLGDVYRQVGLNLLAEVRYLKAANLAAVGDVEGQAAAAAGLGEVYDALGNQDEAIRWVTEARNGYEVLGDMQRLSHLEKQLAELKP